METLLWGNGSLPYAGEGCGQVLVFGESVSSPGKSRSNSCVRRINPGGARRQGKAGCLKGHMAQVSQPPKLRGLQTGLWQSVSKLPGGQASVTPTLSGTAQTRWFPPAARGSGVCLLPRMQCGWSSFLLLGPVQGAQNTQGSMGLTFWGWEGAGQATNKTRSQQVIGSKWNLAMEPGRCF